MINNKIYIRLAFVLILMLIIGVSFNGKFLSAESVSAQKELETNQRFSLPALIQDQSGLTQDPASYSGYTPITDNEEKIVVQVPVEWSDIETGPWTYKNKNVGVFLAASGNLADFYSLRAQSGVLIGVSSSLAHTYSKDGLLGLEKQDISRKCLYKGRFDYQNQFYSGQYDQFTNCANTPGLFVFTAASADKKSLILIRIIVVSDADLEAVDRIINSFQVLGDPERDDHHDN